VNFIQMPHGGRLGHELPYALIERAVHKQIGASAFGATLVVARRPFAKNGRRIEINVSFGSAPSLCASQSAPSLPPPQVGLVLLTRVGEFRLQQFNALHEDLAQVAHVEPTDHVVPWMQTDF
jgi:hypothetical protein